MTGSVMRWEDVRCVVVMPVVMRFRREEDCTGPILSVKSITVSDTGVKLELVAAGHTNFPWSIRPRGWCTVMQSTNSFGTPKLVLF